MHTELMVPMLSMGRVQLFPLCHCSACNCNFPPANRTGSPQTCSNTSAVAAGALVPGCEFPIPALEGDFSLNASNVITTDLLLQSGLQRLALTHDLNAVQMCQLADAAGPRSGQLEVILHQHLPIFHTEHCVFCRFLSTGVAAAGTAGAGSATRRTSVAQPRLSFPYFLVLDIVCGF